MEERVIEEEQRGEEAGCLAVAKDDQASST